MNQNHTACDSVSGRLRSSRSSGPVPRAPCGPYGHATLSVQLHGTAQCMARIKASELATASAPLCSRHSQPLLSSLSLSLVLQLAGSSILLQWERCACVRIVHLHPARLLHSQAKLLHSARVLHCVSLPSSAPYQLARVPLLTHCPSQHLAHLPHAPVCLALQALLHVTAVRALTQEVLDRLHKECLAEF
jgi:hypothetical protein